MIWCHANKMVQVVKEHPAACQRHSFSVVQSRMCSLLALINQWAHLHTAHVSRVLEYLALGYLSTWVHVFPASSAHLHLVLCYLISCKLYMLLEYLNTWVIVYLGTCYRGSWSSMCSLISFNQSVGKHPPVLLKWKSHSEHTFVKYSWDTLSLML